jgi:hypothetical protein
MRAKLDTQIDLDGFLRHLAMTTVVGDNDDIAHWGGGWCNNHYWYHRADINKLEIIKWDPGASQGLYEADMGIPKGQAPLGYRYEKVKLTAWVKNDATAWKTYRTKILQILDGPVAGVQQRIDSIWAQIKPHAYEDPIKGKTDKDPVLTNAQLDAGVAFLKDWYAKRAAWLRGQIGTP